MAEDVQSVTGFLLKGSALSIVLRVGGVALGYALHVVLSRLLGLHDYGFYVIALGWALVLTIPARAGFDQSALRYSTIYLEEDRPGRLRAFIEVAVAAVILGSLAAGFATVELARRLSPEVPRSALLWAAAAILPIALLGVGSVLMRTARRIFAAQFYDQLLRPGLLILVLGGAALGGRSLDASSALLFTALAAAVALVALGIHLVRVLGPALHAAADRSHWREWLSLSLPLLVMGAMQELMNQLEIILLGALAGPREAGLFSAAWRLASLSIFVLVALSAISGPLVASAYHRRDLGELHRITSLSARLALGSAVIAAFVLLVAGRPLLAVFGPEFPAAYPALAILLAGAIVNAATGIVGYLLTLTGRQREALVIFAGALVVSLALNLALIPRLGIAGAAMASATAVSCWNLAMIVYVRRTLGIDASALGLPPRPPRVL